MRLFLLSSVGGFIAVWFVMSGISPSPDDPSPAKQSSGEPISLLTIPRIDDNPPGVRPPSSFASASKIIEEVFSASHSQLKRWLLMPGKRYEVKQLILARLASEDPQEAFELARGSEAFQYYAGSPTVLAEWAIKDFPTALDTLMTSESPNVANFVTGLTAEQVETVYHRLLEEGYDKTSPRSFSQVLPSLAAHKPKEAVERFLEIYRHPDMNFSMNQMHKLIKIWYEKDEQTASEWCLNQEDVDNSRFVMKHYTRVHIAKHGVQGLEESWETLDAKQRERLLADLPYMNDELDDLMEWANQEIRSPIEYQDLVMSLMGNVSRSDHPERLADLVQRLEGELSIWRVGELITDTSERWAFKDPEGLSQWIESIENPEIRSAAEEGLANQLNNQATLKAIQDWGNGGKASVEGEVLDSTMRKIVERAFEISGDYDPQGMIDQLPEAWRAQAIGIYARTYSAEAPEEAIQFLEAQPQSEERDQGLMTNLSHWAAKDPTQAAEWALAREGGSGNPAISSVANIWSRSDPTEAMGWLSKLPPSSARDEAVAQIVPSAAIYHPGDALALAQSVGEEQWATDLVTDIMYKLIRRDPELAEQHLNTLTLSPYVTKRLSEDLEQNRAVRESLRN